LTATLSLPVLPQPRAPDGTQRQAIARQLEALDVGEVRFDQHDRMLYATDASMYQVEPIGVVVPRSIADAERTVRFCAERELAILPRGGGTSLAGQCVNSAIVIDFSAYCRRLIKVDAGKRTARVEPGIVLDHLNAALAQHGLMFGPDVATSSHANLGGMIGNNSAGAYSILYGRTVEHLLALDVMLADGSRMTLDEGAAVRDPRVRDLTQRIANVILPREREIEARFPKTVRHVDGYSLDLVLKQLRESTPGTFDRVNLAHLVCGSEGTLAVTLEATLNLVPTPKTRGLAMLAFNTVDQALRSLVAILQTKPAAVELIDDVVIGVALQNREYCHYVDLLPSPPTGARGAVLYVAYFTDSREHLHARFDELSRLFAQHTISRYDDPAAMNLAWKLRKAGEPLLHGLHGPRRPVTFIEDTAVNPDRLADFVADFRAMVARHGTTAAYYAHASVGCLHIRPMINIKDAADTITMQRIAEDATDLVMRYGGALSGEHGDGRVRTHLLERCYGPVICEAFRHIKAIYDPKNVLNPGNLIDMKPETMVSNLRVKPSDRIVDVPRVKTFFRYEREHGFDEAVEMCNGAGVCRKMKGGTMCPSYRATLDERHATRGRGNALRLAITGQFSPDGRTPKWNDEETRGTLDLCLSCKACKSECPSNVDIAKLKAEYTAQGYAHGERVSLSTRLIANVRPLNRLGSSLHPIANFVNHIGVVRAIGNRLMGFHPKRALPSFGQSLYRWMSRRGVINAGAPAVILFPDCFTVYNEPHIGRAAVTVLEAFGYRVILPKIGCCGRTHLSTGLLGQAQGVCRTTATSLMEVVQRENAIAVVVCEPSCLSAIKDEWLELDMGMDAAALRELAMKSFLVEQFLEERWTEHLRRPEPGRAQSQSHFALHGHCHQKALWGVESSAAILRRLFGERLRVLDSGCCGMAGQFGYQRDHYDLSMRIGEQSIFASLREQPDAIVIAPGTSCRQQIHDGMHGRSAMHPIEAIFSAIWS
jgi:FAD/FMN-containing dehydrogenase/Fe-S oxidoreductase